MNNRTHNQPAQKEQRRQLRTHGTSAEVRLWLMLKNRQVDGMRFRRQHSVKSSKSSMWRNGGRDFANMPC